MPVAFLSAMRAVFPKYTKHLSRVAALWLALATVGAAFANNAKISPDLQPLLGNSSNSINVIVQYNTPASSNGGGLLGGLLGGVLGGVLNLANGLLRTVFSLIPAVSATLHPADV